MKVKDDKWNEVEELKKEKLKLQVQHLKMSNYMLQLDLLEKERKLGLPPSNFTQEVANQAYPATNVAQEHQDAFLLGANYTIDDQGEIVLNPKKKNKQYM